MTIAVSRAKLSPVVLSVDWGTVRAWLALVGGLVALSAYLTQRHDAKRRLAKAVYVVVSDFGYAEATPTVYEVKYRLVNNGELPIYEPRVAVWQKGLPRFTWRLHPHVCTWMAGERVLGSVPNAIEPHKDQVETLKASDPAGGHWPTDYAPAISVIFRDSNNRHWIHFPTQRVRRVYLAYFYREIREPPPSVSRVSRRHTPT